MPAFDTDLYTGAISTFNSKVCGPSAPGFVPFPQRLAGSSHPRNMTTFKVDLIVGYRECEIIGGNLLYRGVFPSAQPVLLRIRAGWAAVPQRTSGTDWTTPRGRRVGTVGVLGGAIFRNLRITVGPYR